MDPIASTRHAHRSNAIKWHAPQSPNLLIKSVIEQKHSIRISWRRACKRLARIPKTRVVCFVRAKLANLLPRVGYIRMGRLAAIPIRIHRKAIIASMDGVRWVHLADFDGALTSKLWLCIVDRQKFTCDNSTVNYFKADPTFCPDNFVTERVPSTVSSNEILLDEPQRGYKKYHHRFSPSAASLVQEYNRNGRINATNNHQDIFNTEISNVDSPDTTTIEPNKSKPTTPSSAYSRRNSPTKENYRQRPIESTTIPPRQSKGHAWTVKSGCHISCMDDSKGIQIVKSNLDDSMNIQLCEADTFVCHQCHHHLHSFPSTSHLILPFAGLWQSPKHLRIRIALVFAIPAQSSRFVWRGHANRTEQRRSRSQLQSRMPRRVSATSILFGEWWKWIFSIWYEMLTRQQWQSILCEWKMSGVWWEWCAVGGVACQSGAISITTLHKWPAAGSR